MEFFGIHWVGTAGGPVSAGLAFALQQVVTAIAGYSAILRGWGGVRGDALRLGFGQTTIMEMGQPPSVQGADPAHWIVVGLPPIELRPAAAATPA